MRELLLNLLILVGMIAAPFWFAQSGDTYEVNLVSRIAIVGMAAVGLNLALGYGGMVSFGHAAFFGLGGYAAGVSAYHAFDGSLFMGMLAGTDQMLVIWPIAVIACAILAFFIGLISLRTQGVYFIMITLAFAQMIYYLAISVPTYGGEDGLSIYVRNQVPYLSDFVAMLDSRYGVCGGESCDALAFSMLALAGLFLALFVSWRIMSARFGAALTMARLNDMRLATTGTEPFPIKLTTFVISAMITGLAGALFADLNGFVGPSMLSWHRSGELIVIVILGGVGRLFGPLIGAMLFVLLETKVGDAAKFMGELTGRDFSAISEYWQFFLGLVLLLVVLFARGGVIGLLAGRERHD